jgi:hypothetical protein
VTLAALDPPPAALEPGAPPPWPAPTGRFVEPMLPQLGTAYSFIGASVVPFLLAFFTMIEGKHGLSKVAVVVGVLLAGFGVLKLRSAKALLPAHRARYERAARCWARIKSSRVLRERHDRGVLSRYELELDLEVWDPSARDSVHRSAPSSTPVRTEASVPAALGPHVVPGAFFAVAFDPVERSALPFTLLTREGAQLPV